MSFLGSHLPATLREKSTWTPKSFVPSNQKIFLERMALIKKWYPAWSEQQRWTLLEYVLRQLSDPSLVSLHSLLHPIMPPADHDFTRALPRHLCLLVFSYLDPKSLCRAARVCWYWKHLSEANEMWKPKCLRRGWFLPTPPSPYDTTAWKRLYIGSVTQLHWSLPQPPVPGGDSEGEGGSVCDMPEGEGGLGRGKGQPEQRIRRHRGGWAPAKPWLPPDRHPNEIAKGTIYGSSLIDGRLPCLPIQTHIGNLRHSSSRSPAPPRERTRSQPVTILQREEDPSTVPDLPPALIHPTLLEKLRLGSPAKLCQKQNVDDARDYVYQPRRLAVQKLQDSSPFPELPSFYEDRIMEAWQQGGSLQKERVWRVQTAREEGGGKHHLKARGRGKGTTSQSPELGLVSSPWNLEQYMAEDSDEDS